MVDCFENYFTSLLPTIRFQEEAHFCQFFFFSLGVQEGIHYCERGKPACACSADNHNCVFYLEIDEIRTFTRYQKIFEGKPTGVAMRGTKGMIYYVAENGTALPLDPDRTCSTLNSTKCTKPQFVDGKTYRLAIAVNGQVPGPTLIVYEEIGRASCRERV